MTFVTEGLDRDESASAREDRLAVRIVRSSARGKVSFGVIEVRGSDEGVEHLYVACDPVDGTYVSGCRFPAGQGVEEAGMRAMVPGPRVLEGPQTSIWEAVAVLAGELQRHGLVWLRRRLQLHTLTD